MGAFLVERARRAEAAGLAPERVVLDAGLDLGKTAEQSLELLRASDRLAALGYPVLLSASNKTFLGRILDLEIGERQAASTAAAALGVVRGCRVLRVHDVRGARQVRDLMAAILEGAMSTPSDSPVVLIRGDDAVLLADAVRSLVSDLVGDEDASLAVEDLDLDANADDRLGALLDACLTPPFLTSRRVVLARNAGVLSADDAVRLIEYLDQPLDSTRLVLVGGGGTVPAKLVTAVKKVGSVIDAGAPRQARDRTTWLTEQLRAAPVKVDAAAGHAIGEHIGQDVHRLSGILEVLKGVYGEGAHVGLAQVEPFLGEAGGVAPWDLTDAVDKGDQASALSLLHRFLAGGHALVVISTLHRHYGQMLRLDGSGARNEKDAAAVLGLKGSTFPAKKALDGARRMGSAPVRRAIVLVAEADLDLRGQKSWPDRMIMEVLVTRLCLLARR